MIRRIGTSISFGLGQSQRSRTVEGWPLSHHEAMAAAARAGSRREGGQAQSVSTDQVRSSGPATIARSAVP